MSIQYEKPNYSSNQINQYIQETDLPTILVYAEHYLQKKLNYVEIKTIIYFMDILHFSEDMIGYLWEYCVKRNKTNFNYIEKVAISWAEKGYTTPEEVQQGESKIYEILHALGKANIPTKIEIEYISKWLNTYKMPLDIVKEACERTVLATEKNRILYADKIIEGWHQNGVHNIEDIKDQDHKYRESKKQKAQKKNSKNSFNNFEQNQYDFTELEKELLSNKT